MKTTTKFLALVVLTLAACGDNLQRPDARKAPDGPPPDAQCSNCPAAPALGTQIDRMGRPAINTLLNHGFDSTAGAQTAKTAYNNDADPANWVTANVPEFMKNLGVLDALDTGLCGNGKCETAEFNYLGQATTCNAAGEDCATATPSATNNGCGNQVLYNGGQGTTPNAMSYATLAGILAADELYLDTSKTVCEFYLAVEFGVATGLGNTTCGGRAPQYDVIDYSLSMIVMGLAGFTTSLQPRLGDGVTAHTDYASTFPYLGPPHTP